MTFMSQDTKLPANLAHFSQQHTQHVSEDTHWMFQPFDLSTCCQTTQQWKHLWKALPWTGNEKEYSCAAKKPHSPVHKNTCPSHFLCLRTGGYVWIMELALTTSISQISGDDTGRAKEDSKAWDHRWWAGRTAVLCVHTTASCFPYAM